MGDQFCSVFTQEDMSELIDLGQSRTPSVQPIKVNIKGVLELLKVIKLHKATGHDNIPGSAEELAPGLAHHFRISIDNGKFPLVWKPAIIHRQQTTGLFRLRLFTVCKILEHIIHTSVLSHFERNNILTACQHGFRKRRL